MLPDPLIVERLAACLLPVPPVAPADSALVPDWAPVRPFDTPPVPAAVLIALVRRSTGHTVLYTERSPELRAHSGQVAFPGGKIDRADAGAGAAALREADEEVGLVRADARILGFMPIYFTGSNYLITPVVAEIVPTRPFVPNPHEVRAVFEVPLRHILDAASYGRFQLVRNGKAHSTWRIGHEGYTIWGITANLTRNFRELILREGIV